MLVMMALIDDGMMPTPILLLLRRGTEFETPIAASGFLTRGRPVVTPFPDRLADAVRRSGPLCIGLDPRVESFPLALRPAPGSGLAGLGAALESFGKRVLELARPFAGVAKPQSAFYELAGPPGLIALRNTLRYARSLGYVTILDSKRGDIATTAAAYAEAAFGESAGEPVWDADALTVNPYLGADAVGPFAESAARHGRGLFVLVRTSNPGAGLFQDLDCGGRKLYEVVADAVASWNAPTITRCGYGAVGAVAGATRPRELAALRERLPGVWLLVPGYGAQGGSARDIRAAYDTRGSGAVVNSSRGVTFPFKPDDADWEARIAAACAAARDELAF